MPKRRLLIINPNSTEVMTRSILRVAEAAASDDMELHALTNRSAPPAIEGPEDGAAAVPGVLDAIKQNPDFDGFLIACFDDTGLSEAKAASSAHVIGIGEASFAAAAAHGAFCIVTTVPEAEPVIEANVARSKAASLCHGVAAAGISVLDLEFDKEKAIRHVSEEIKKQKRIHNVSTVILGCAGMGGVLPALSDRVGGHLVEPVTSGIRAFAKLSVRSDTA